MRYVTGVVATLFLLVAACSSEEPSSGSAPQIEEETAESAPGEAPADEAEGTDEPVELVEESAAEVDDGGGEQPLLLAQVENGSATQDWKFTENQHFMRMVPTQPTVGGSDRIEVAEFFWYGCGHCLDFEPYVNGWAADKPANVRFVRIPATWNPLVKLHAQLYYTEEVLARNGKIADPEGFRAAMFNEYHRRGNRMTSESAIQDVFERQGVSAEDFASTWNSFEVAQKLRVAQDLQRRYAVTGVPTIVVNGKYRTGAGEAGGYPRLLEVIDELVARESIR
ncbi:MAG: thiol:disulfide interchange protein DsbA/DsbL [Woeseiaceae bacterium]